VTAGVEQIVARPSLGERAPVEVQAPRGNRRPALDSTFLVSLGVVAVGLGLRLWSLGANQLGFDEAFTAMAGRRPFGDLLSYLRVRDSHPPLDYLLRSPLSRAGLSAFWLRVPSVACSAAAVLLVAWWLRRRGVVGVLATALMALSVFELSHGRDARMYADLELLGVACAMVSEAWLVRPRRRHAVAIGALVAVGLMLHTSMLLFGAGLLALPGLRRDAHAWRWRGALFAGFSVWAVLWGPSFLQQAGGGHSSWIPPTTLAGLIDSFGRLVLYDPRAHVVILVGVAIGAVAMWHCDRTLARVVTCCSFVPIGLVALAGLVAPVLLDRTLTLMAWGPMVALAFVVRASPGRRVRQALTWGALATLLVAMTGAAWRNVSTRSHADRVLHHLEQEVRSGDVVAYHPAHRLDLVAWALGVQAGRPFRIETLSAVPDTAAIWLDPAIAPTGRVWLVDWYDHHLTSVAGTRCAPEWRLATARVTCLLAAPPVAAVSRTEPALQEPAIWPR
jgi:hypothetical protein